MTNHIGNTWITHLNTKCAKPVSPGAGVPRMRWIRHLKSWAKPFRVQAYREHDITWHNMIFLTTGLWGIILFWEFRHFLSFFWGYPMSQEARPCLSPGLVGPHGHCSLGPWCALPQPIHAESAYGGCGRKHWATAPRRRVWSSAVFWAVG